jgi:YidC/Oxa1 family membrane protein insertase
LLALVMTYLVSQITGSLIATRAMQGGQRGLMLALPLLFVGIVARFPAGLAVYWITTSLWTLGQQLAFWRLGAGALPELGGGAALATAGGPPPSEPAPPPAPSRPSGAAGQSRKRQSRKRKHGRRR